MGKKQSKIKRNAVLLPAYSEEVQVAARLARSDKELFDYHPSKPSVSQKDLDTVKADLASTNETLENSRMGHSQSAKEPSKVRNELIARTSETVEITDTLEVLRLQNTRVPQLSGTRLTMSLSGSLETLSPHHAEILRMKEMAERGLDIKTTKGDEFLPLDQDPTSEPSDLQHGPPEPAYCTNNDGIRKEGYVENLLKSVGVSVEYCCCQRHCREEQAKANLEIVLPRLIASEKALKREVSTLEEKFKDQAKVERDLKKVTANISTTSIHNEAKFQELKSRCESQKRAISQMKIENQSLEMDNKQLREKVGHLEDRKVGQAGKIKSLEAQLANCKQSLLYAKSSLQCAGDGGAFEAVASRGQQRASTQQLLATIKSKDAQLEALHAECQQKVSAQQLLTTIKSKDDQVEALHAEYQNRIQELQEEQRLQRPFYEGGKKVRASYMMVRHAQPDIRNERNVFAHEGNIILDLALIDIGHFEGEDASKILALCYGEGVRGWVPIEARNKSGSVPAALLQHRKVLDILNGRSCMYHQWSFSSKSYCRQTDSNFEELMATFWELISGVKCLEDLHTEAFRSSLDDLHSKMRPLWEKIIDLATNKRAGRHTAGISDAEIHELPGGAIHRSHALGEYLTSDSSAKIKNSRKNKKKKKSQKEEKE